MKLAVDFEEGKPSSIRVLEGPASLRDTATNYIKTWQVFSTSNGICEVTVSFRFIAEEKPHCFKRPDTVRYVGPRHLEVLAFPVWLCDPSATHSYVQHRLLFFRWKTGRKDTINEIRED